MQVSPWKYSSTGLPCSTAYGEDFQPNFMSARLLDHTSNGFSKRHIQLFVPLGRAHVPTLVHLQVVEQEHYR